MKTYIKSLLFTFAVIAIIVPSVLSVRAEDSQVDKLKAALPMMTGITIKLTPAEQNSREMPWWMAMIFDTTNPDEPESVAMVTECFQNLPCYKVEIVPQWKFLFQFMSKLNISLPPTYMSSLNQPMTDQYLIDNCGKKPAKNFTKQWNFQITAGDSAYSYDIGNMYCSDVKTVDNGNGPQVTQYTLTFSKLAESAN